MKRGTGPISLSTRAEKSERVDMETNNANDAYKAARERVHSRIIRLQDLLNAHSKKQKNDPRNWGFVGDFNHVIEVLDEAIAFLVGEKEKTK